MVAMVELGLDYSDYFDAFRESDRRFARMNIAAANANANAMHTMHRLNSTGDNSNSSAAGANLYQQQHSVQHQQLQQQQLQMQMQSGAQFNLNKYLIPESVLIVYAVVTCLLVGVHMLALMISTCILPQIEASSFEHHIELQHKHSQPASHHHHHQRASLNKQQPLHTQATTPPLQQQQQQQQQHQSIPLHHQHSHDSNLLSPPLPGSGMASNTRASSASSAPPSFNNQHSAHQHHHYHQYQQQHHGGGGRGMLYGAAAAAAATVVYPLVFPYNQFHRFIELAWLSSTVLGIFLFLVEIGLVCYIKFYPISHFAALAGAIVMLPILVLFILFTITFYKRLADFKLNITTQFYNQVNRNLMPLNDDDAGGGCVDDEYGSGGGTRAPDVDYYDQHIL